MSKLSNFLQTLCRERLLGLLIRYSRGLGKLENLDFVILP